MVEHPCFPALVRQLLIVNEQVNTLVVAAKGKLKTKESV